TRKTLSDCEAAGMATRDRNARVEIRMCTMRRRILSLSRGALVSFNDVIRPKHQRSRNRQPQRLGSLQVDDEFECGRLLNGQICGLGTFQDLVDVGGGTAEIFNIVGAVAHEPTGFWILA